MSRSTSMLDGSLGSWAAQSVSPTRSAHWGPDAFPWLLAPGRAGKPLVFSRPDEVEAVGRLTREVPR